MRKNEGDNNKQIQRNNTQSQAQLNNKQNIPDSIFKEKKRKIQDQIPSIITLFICTQRRVNSSDIPKLMLTKSP